MEKIRNLSIKKTIILYIAISLFCSFFLSTVIINLANYTQKQIWWKYVDEEKYYQAIADENGNYTTSIPRISRNSMSKIDANISEFCDFLDTYTVLFLSFTGCCIAVILFYKNKIKPPLDELSNASQLIAQDELDFYITYQNQDEVGQLCKEFEKMRAQLEENNRVVWRMMEDEKALRAAIAHDIRSPLSVLKGYQEMLLEFISNETCDKEKTLEMLQSGMNQIERINHFVEQMRTLSKLEERNLHFADIDVMVLKDRIQKETSIISNGTGKECVINLQTDRQNFIIDIDVVLEVIENLLSNALRYSKEKIEIALSSKEQDLIITVIDDGNGFSENAETVTKPFYHSNPHDDLQHFGMGMYISKVYCERHGGKLIVGNQVQGGALVKAIFKSN